MNRIGSTPLRWTIGTLVSLAAIAAVPVSHAIDDPAIPKRVRAVFPATWRFPAGARATFAPHAMVASDSRIASNVGAQIMRDGGNAIDAAVAMAFALAVAYPEAGNLGGGGYMVIRMADGRVAALDYRTTAPLAATRDMYVGADGKVTGESLVGPRASGVPGAVAGLIEAHRRFGSVSLARILAPAIALARDGFVIDTTFAHSVSSNRYRIEDFDGKRIFFANGVAPVVGSRFVQPALARTLRLIADSGAAVFYRGSIADSIAAQMKRSGGLITREDLSRYRPVWRNPIRSSYRGYSLIAMPPSSSGGTTVTEILQILEAYGPAAKFGTAARVHAVASASQRAFFDRNSKLGDPAFAEVPLATLTSKAYAKSVARTISHTRAERTTSLASQVREGSETTHHSVVDQLGNAVATTTTLNDLYGSGVYISAAGFFMNDDMDDFTIKPGVPNMFGLIQGEVNAIAPGKRMLSAMSPTILLDPKGNLLLVVGARGGPRIISATAEVILNVVDHRMSIADAMSAPRIHHQSLPDSIRLESGGFDSTTITRLHQMGHHTYDLFGIASGHAVMRVKGGYEGMPDPRSRGAAVGF